MKRSRLARVLQDEAIRRGIRIEYGRRLSRAEVAADGRVLATFEDGSTAAGDLLIGADGVHSVVRRAIDPAAPSGRYVGLTNFGGVTRGAANGIEPEAWHLVFGRRAFFGYQATPDGDVVWFANVPRPLITPDERASTTEAAWRRQLADLFAGDAGPAVELIEAGELELAADNTHDLGHVPVWHRGPMIIIGDAAHAPAPTSGQGASMAIEDAIALAGELGAASSIEAAFAAYEQRRRERVEKIVAWGARGSSDKVPGRFGRIARDVMLRILFRWVITEKSLGWMYDYRIGLAGATRRHSSPRGDDDRDDRQLREPVAGMDRGQLPGHVLVDHRPCEQQQREADPQDGGQSKRAGRAVDPEATDEARDDQREHEALAQFERGDDDRRTGLLCPRGAVLCGRAGEKPVVDGTEDERRDGCHGDGEIVDCDHRMAPSILSRAIARSALHSDIEAGATSLDT